MVQGPVRHSKMINYVVQSQSKAIAGSIQQGYRYWHVMVHKYGGGHHYCCGFSVINLPQKIRLISLNSLYYATWE